MRRNIHSYTVDAYVVNKMTNKETNVSHSMHTDLII